MTVSIIKQGCNHKTPSLLLHFQLAQRQLCQGCCCSQTNTWSPQWVFEGLIRKPLPQEGNAEMEVLLTWELGRW